MEVGVAGGSVPSPSSEASFSAALVGLRFRGGGRGRVREGVTGKGNGTIAGLVLSGALGIQVCFRVEGRDEREGHGL